MKYIKKNLFSYILILFFTISCNTKESNSSLNKKDNVSIDKKAQKTNNNKLLYGDLYYDMTYNEVINSETFKKVENNTIVMKYPIDYFDTDNTIFKDKLTHLYSYKGVDYDSAYYYLSSKMKLANRAVHIGNYKYNLNALFYKDSLFGIYLTSEGLNTNLNNAIEEIETIISANNGTPTKYEIKKGHLKPNKQKESDRIEYNATHKGKKHFERLDFSLSLNKDDYITPKPYSLFEWKLAYKTIRITHHEYERQLTIEILKENSINNMLNDYQNYLSENKINNNKIVNEESKKF